MSTPTPRRVLITGASAGIGAALARHYAAPGTTLGLVARRAERLAGLADTLRAAGAEVRTYTADVRDAAAMRAVADDFGAGGVELAIANAGISRGDRLAAGDPAPAADVFAINVTGVLNTLVPLVPGMQRRGGGHLVTVSSVAGFRGIPGNSFDGQCNYSMGLQEQTVFPEIDPDKVKKAHGMDITFVTSAKNNGEAKELLTLMGMPFASGK